MPIEIYPNHSNNNHFDSQLENMVEAGVQDDHYFSSCLSVRAPYFSALSDLPLLIFYTEKDAFRSSSHQQFIEPYTPKWLKNQNATTFCTWEREALRGVHWNFLEFSYGSESHNNFFAFSVLLKGLLKALCIGVSF